MDAMQVGDKELAYAYARKYVRYLRDLKNRNREVVELTDVAINQVGSIT